MAARCAERPKGFRASDTYLTKSFLRLAQWAVSSYGDPYDRQRSANYHHADIIGTFAAFILHRLHCARIKTRILGNELAAMETALRGGLVDPESAITHIYEVGAGDLLTWESSQ
jgi:hypothetical protein